MACPGAELSFHEALAGAQGNVKFITDDVAALRPTLFIAVPRVLERMASGIQAKVRKMPFFSRLIFNLAYNYKRWRLKSGVAAEQVCGAGLCLFMLCCFHDH